MSTNREPTDGGIEAQGTSPRCCGRNGDSSLPSAGADIKPKANAEGSKDASEKRDGQNTYYTDCDDDNDDTDVIVVEIKNGCDNTRLEKNNTASSLHKHLQKVQIGTKEPKPTPSYATTASEARQLAINNPLKQQYNQNTKTGQAQCESKGTKNDDGQQSSILNVVNTQAKEQPSSSTNASSTACSIGPTNPEGAQKRSDSKPIPNVNPSCEFSQQQKRPLAFLKSQSLDYNDESALSNPYQYLPSHLLPDICENRSTDIKNQDATKFSSVNDSLGSLDQLDQSENAQLDNSGVATAPLQGLESRKIYPNVPYSPYASPYGSPRSNRRRPPLRESRRISIEKSGSFLQLNQYKLLDQIGQGSYGLVKLAYSEEDSTHYAMKILSKRRLLRQAGLMRRGPKKATSPLDRVYREIAVLKKLDHPNIVKLVEVLDDPVEDSLYMVFELVKQGEVLAIPTDKPLTEERAWSVLRDTLLGLEYLHYQKIIHADLKPGNLLLTECGHVKIADLGVCNEFLGEDATMTNGSTAGTPAFRAPETIVLGQNVYCGRAADIWALGATLYSLVFGNVPFLANSIPLLYEKVKADDVVFPTTPKISPELQHCISRMLEKDASQRITLPQLKINNWVTASGTCPLPTEDENCCLVQVDDEDINSVVRSIPKLDTLILIKTMLKKHSFGNPFARGSISGKAPQRGGSRLERFVRAGRSNSAPGSYHMAVDRQQSVDNILPALTEHCSIHNEES